MPSFRSTASKAQHAAKQTDAKSLGTQRNYAQAIKGAIEYMQDEKRGLDDQDLGRETVDLYLAMRSQEVAQSTLDLDRQALQAHLGIKLPMVYSELSQALDSRAYTAEQTAMVASAQSSKHSLATELAANAGLRAHELLTLRPSDEQPRDTHREYRDDRFAGRENVEIYTVVGKGGLCREVAIDRDLAARLEAMRLPQSIQVVDRSIPYKQFYEIGGGKNWSDSFSKASDRALGWSNGGHGLRHEYAQDRMNTLQSIGYAYRDALEVVSQEMGHFRADITEVYLR